MEKHCTFSNWRSFFNSGVMVGAGMSNLFIFHNKQTSSIRKVFIKQPRQNMTKDKLNFFFNVL